MSSDRARTFFDGYAGDFDAIYNRRSSFGSRVVNHIFRRSMQLRYLKTLEGCHPIEGKTVLDVGCGPGHYSISLAQRGAAHVVGIDFAGGMLRLATEHARQAGVAGRCEFREADFLTFISEPFDYLILMGFMDYIPEPGRVIEKVLSLTRSKAFLSFPSKADSSLGSADSAIGSAVTCFSIREVVLRNCSPLLPELRLGLNRSGRISS